MHMRALPAPYAPSLIDAAGNGCAGFRFVKTTATKTTDKTV